jgi:hypothetical protein
MRRTWPGRSPVSSIPSPHPNRPRRGLLVQHGAGLTLLPLHQLKGHALNQRGQDELRLHHHKMIAGADVWASAERQIGVARDLRLVLWRPPLRVEALRSEAIVYCD